MDLEMVLTLGITGLFIYAMKNKPAAATGGSGDTGPPPPGGGSGENPPPPPPPGGGNGGGNGGENTTPPAECIPSPTAIGYTNGLITTGVIVWARPGVPRPPTVPPSALWWIQQSDGYHMLPSYNFGDGQPFGPGGVPYCPPPDWLGYQ